MNIEKENKRMNAFIINAIVWLILDIVALAYLIKPDNESITFANPWWLLPCIILSLESYFFVSLFTHIEKTFDVFEQKWKGVAFSIVIMAFSILGYLFGKEVLKTPGAFKACSITVIVIIALIFLYRANKLIATKWLGKKKVR